MIKSVLSCHFQLSRPLFRLFFFCPICHHHATGYTCHPKSFNFSFLDSLFSSISLSGFHSLLLSSPIPLSFLLSVLFWLFLGICDSVITSDLGGRQRGRSSALRDALRGFSLWKPSNLNADGNIFRGFNSTVCNIPNKALFCFFYTGSVVTLIKVFYDVVLLTNSEHLNVEDKKRKENSLSQLVLSLLKLCNYVVFLFVGMLTETVAPYSPRYSLILWSETAHELTMDY